MAELNAHQKKAVQALENLQEICDRHGLTLYLMAGTALGAIRHKGMIPWDDDIDVGLTYDEWYRLRKILANEIDDQFEYVDYENTPGFPRLFGKILYDKQNCVDIFLIAKWTDSAFWGNVFWQIHRTATTFYLFSLNYRAPIKPNLTKKQFIHMEIMRKIRYFVYLLSKPFCSTGSYIRLAKWVERFFENRKADCYINLYSIYKMEKEKIRKEWVENPSKVLFEGKEYNSFGDIDAYLTHLYGDYMTPPPVDKRAASHGEVFK